MGYKRDNALQNMLSPDAYHSRLTNRVFISKLAWMARAAETTKRKPFFGYRTTAGSQAYNRTVRGLPMNPWEVKKLLTVVNGGKRFKDDDILAAWMLLRELYNVARRTMPTIWNRAMGFIHQPGKFDPNVPNPCVVGLLSRIPQLLYAAPPRRTDAPPPETAMDLDMQGEYLLFNNRPGSANPITGVDFDYAYQVGRRSVFGYALG